ncbi:hypothetical protein WN51_02087 [Melipona quadrifasciata]|uniref:CUB domain-containing protein n=1 Tax=Melipona quadrifasciata TaxID=166423 RepID=A0A0N0U4M9_9HYME|nr:hypothetical protein WN51_02087 [Melipona quadrifasciata]
MILGRVAVYFFRLISLANVGSASVSQLRRSVLSWSSVCALIVLPSDTQQWSLLGLNPWPFEQTVERPSVDEFDLSGNSISRVLNFFPTPVQEECLSQDKRRRGICMNTYECRIQRGKSYGRCALGFGVCCIFTTTCEQKVQNNLTYVISPGFPNLIDWPMNCSVVVQKIDRQVSQLRIDFVHFNIGQPNSRTGVCDEDVMEIRNGRSVFQMCGWNSGQHRWIESAQQACLGDQSILFDTNLPTVEITAVYIDMDDDEQSLTLDLRLLGSLQPRMWEMRIVQLGFDQRAPTGCFQYFQGSNGTLKSLNFLSNGRFLANQDYLLCIRQERGMCGISYAPCSPDSFRIGLRRTQLVNGTTPNANSNSNSTMRNTDDAGFRNGTNIEIEGSGSSPMDDDGTSMNTSNSTEQEVAPSSGAVYGQERCRDRVLIPCDFEEFITVMFLACLRRLAVERSSRDVIEFNGENIQGPGNNEAGICNLEHCGSSLCDRNEVDEEGNCRVETWATPFRIRVAFGPGQDTGTTLEDNIGMCLVVTKIPRGTQKDK